MVHGLINGQSVNEEREISDKRELCERGKEICISHLKKEK